MPTSLLPISMKDFEINKFKCLLRAEPVAVSHKGPSKSWGQVHMKAILADGFEARKHIPPFWHGLLVHASEKNMIFFFLIQTKYSEVTQFHISYTFWHMCRPVLSNKHWRLIYSFIRWKTPRNVIFTIIIEVKKRKLQFYKDLG